MIWAHWHCWAPWAWIACCSPDMSLLPHTFQTLQTKLFTAIIFSSSSEPWTKTKIKSQMKLLVKDGVLLLNLFYSNDKTFTLVTKKPKLCVKKKEKNFRTKRVGDDHCLPAWATLAAITAIQLHYIHFLLQSHHKLVLAAHYTSYPGHSCSHNRLCWNWGGCR